MISSFEHIPPEWRRRLLYALAVVLALAGAFSAGRFSSPAVVETKIVKEKGETITIHDKAETIYIHDKAEAKIVWRDRVIDAKTGNVTEHEIEKTDTKEADHVALTVTSDRVATLTEHTEATKTVTNLPRWRVSVGVGAFPFHAPLLPIAGPLVILIGGEYRIVGGLAAGIILTTNGEGFVTVSFSF